MTHVDERIRSSCSLNRLSTPQSPLLSASSVSRPMTQASLFLDLTRVGISRGYDGMGTFRRRPPSFGPSSGPVMTPRLLRFDSWCQERGMRQFVELEYNMPKQSARVRVNRGAWREAQLRRVKGGHVESIDLFIGSTIIIDARRRTLHAACRQTAAWIDQLGAALQRLLFQVDERLAKFETPRKRGISALVFGVRNADAQRAEMVHPSRVRSGTANLRLIAIELEQNLLKLDSYTPEHGYRDARAKILASYNIRSQDEEELEFSYFLASTQPFPLATPV